MCGAPSTGRTGDVESDRFARRGFDVPIRMAEAAKGDFEDCTQVAWIVERGCADRHSNLLLVVPELREFAPDIEPAL